MKITDNTITFKLSSEDIRLASKCRMAAKNAPCAMRYVNPASTTLPRKLHNDGIIPKGQSHSTSGKLNTIITSDAIVSKRTGFL